MTEQKKTEPHDAEALATAHNIYQDLLTKQQSIILSTINADGSPHASYTPFAIDDKKNFYIFISTLAHHTGNLMNKGQVSIMVIADEAETSQIFARHRLTFTCQVEVVERDSDDWDNIASLYEARFGSFFNLIKGFKDFSMFKLVPQGGALVVGFGQAYNLEGDTLDELTLRRE